MDFFKKYFLDVITKRFFELNGRAGRKEFWIFSIISFAISYLLGIVGSAIGLEYVMESSFLNSLVGVTGGAGDVVGFPINILGLIYGLIVLLPSFALTIRRLHDIGKSGWWQLIIFIPILGLLVLIIFFILPSQAGVNRYGAESKVV